MPVCLHGWGSDGINPSGCPQCTEMGINQDRRDRESLRAQVEVAVRALDLIAGTHGTECAHPRAEAAEALREMNRLNNSR